MNLTIDVNVNFPGLTAFFSQLKGIAMDTQAQVTALTAKVDELVASNADLAAKVTESNGKVDNLLVVASTTKDALVALQAATPAAAPDLQPLVDKLQGAIDANATTKAAIEAEEGKVDSASSTIAP